VHLGERLVAVSRIRSGVASVGETSRALGVAEVEVEGWMRDHANERVHSLEELRRGGSATHVRLSERAHRLAALVAESERELRDLHQELLRGLEASNDEDAEASKEFGGNSHSGAPRVARAQRDPARARKFVDGDSTR
jgi:hypothetical protein